MSLRSEGGLELAFVGSRQGTRFGRFACGLESQDKPSRQEESRSPTGSGEKGKTNEDENSIEEEAEVELLGYENSALNAACDILINWKAIWEANPLILSCVLRFLDVV
jgi:hypothetical protein